MSGNGHNNVYSGCNAPQDCDRKDSCYQKPEKECDSIKTLSIGMGVVSGVTCGGEMVNLPISVINPKNNSDENINKVLFDLCAAIQAASDNTVNIISADDCIDVTTSKCDVELSLNVLNLLNKICNSNDLREILKECILEEEVQIDSLTFDNTTRELVVTETNGDFYAVIIPEKVCVVTTLVDNGDNTLTYVNEDGVSQTFVVSETLTSVQRDGDELVYVDENGDETRVDLCCDDVITTLTDNGNNTLDYVNEQGDVSTFQVIETVTTVSREGDELVYADELGDETRVDLCCDDVVTNLTDNGDNSLTYVNEDGVSQDFVVTIPAETLTFISVNPDNSGFSYTDEDGQTTSYLVPDDVVTSITDNGDGTFTYVNEDGDSVTIDMCNCPVTQVISSDGTVTVVNTGTVDAPVFDLSVVHTVDINTDMFTYDSATNVLTITETDGETHSVNLSSLIDPETVTTMVIQVDGSTVYTNESGVRTIIPAPVTVKSTDGSVNIASTGTATAPCYDIGAVIPPSVQIQSATFDSNTGILTITETDGDTFPVDLASLVSDPETVTSIVDTGVSFSYTNESGATVVVDYCCDDVVTSVTQNSDGGFTYVDEEGNPTVVDGTCTYLENAPDVGDVVSPLMVVTVDPVDGGCGRGSVQHIQDCAEEAKQGVEQNRTDIEDLQSQIDALPDAKARLQELIAVLNDPACAAEKDELCEILAAQYKS